MTPTPLSSLAVELVPLDELRADPANPRKISDDELDTLTRSVRTFGFIQPVVARRADKVVIGGHQRLVAARRAGLTAVPVIWLDVTTEEGHLLGLALNRISGTWDEQLLARLLAELREIPSVDLSLSGFGEDEVKDLLRSLTTAERRERPESFDIEAALEEASRQPRARRGDVWALGDHRVSCGDATQVEDVQRLLGGERAAMAFQDPPYNVALGDHGGQQRGTRRRRIANDDLDPLAWETFCRGWADLLLASTDGAIYVCMSSKELPLVWRILEEAGGHWSDTIIWHKDRPLCWGERRYSVPTSRSGSGGARAPSRTGAATATRATSGRSIGRPRHRSDR